MNKVDRKKIFSCIGASNHSATEREKNDYYATDPSCVEDLLKREQFDTHIWECAAGGGHIADVLIKHGYEVQESDIINRGRTNFNYYDMLKQEDVRGEKITKWYGDIITNPPYKYAKEFIENCINMVDEKRKIAMFLKLTFLEGQARGKFFMENPPKRIYVYSKRAKCAINGNFDNTGSSAVAYAWFIWEKGFKGKPEIEWINDDYLN